MVLKVDTTDAKEKMMVAKELVKAQHLEEAIEIYEELKVQNVLRERALLELGELYLQKERWREAKAVYLEMLSLDPNSRKAIGKAKAVFLRIAEPDNEADFFEKLLKDERLRRKDARLDIMTRLREIYESTENLICLSRIVEQLQKINPANSDYALDLSRMYIEMGRFDEQALKIYEKAYHLARELPELEKQLTRTYRELKKDRWRHLDICMNYFKSNRDDLENIRYLATVFMEKDETVDDFIEAIYREALERELCDRGALMFHLGLFYESRRKFREAIEYFEGSYKAGFAIANHHPLRRLGILYAGLRDLTNARKYLLLQCQKFSGDEESLQLTKKILLSPSEKEHLNCDELGLLKTIIDRKPDIKDYVFVGSELIKKCGDFKLALKCYQAASNIDPSHLKILAGIRECMMGLGEYVEAASTLKNILSQKLKKDERLKYTFELASIYSRDMLDFDKALLYLNQFLSKDPGNYQALIEKVSIYEKMKDDKKYHESIRQAWSRHVTDRQILRKLSAYYDEKGSEGASQVVKAILSFLGAERRENQIPSVALTGLRPDDCIHKEEKRGKERLDSYIGILKIKEEEDHPELESLRQDLRELEIPPHWGRIEEMCAKILGEFPVVFYSYEKDETFRTKVFIEKGKNYLIINVPVLERLPASLKLSLIASGLVHLKHSHPLYQQYIHKINLLVNEQVEKVIKYLESTVKSSGEFFKAPLFIMFGLLRSERSRKIFLDKIRANIEGLRKYPGLADMVEDLARLVLLQEGAEPEFLRGFSYTTDRIVYAICKDLYTATLTIFYDAAISDPAPSQELMTTLLKNEDIAARVAELWTFALDLETRQ